MQRNGPPSSIFAWVRDVLATLCPLPLARMMDAWVGEPRRIPIPIRVRIPIDTDERRPR